MRLLRRWLLRRVLRSAVTFERESVGLYRELMEDLGQAAPGALGHLVEEESMHQRLLDDTAGKVDDRLLSELLTAHRYHALEEIGPLSGELLARLGGKLEQARRDEESTLRFYENLGRISSIRPVKLAFRVLADMEREHLGILERLLGTSGAPAIRPDRPVR